jgi:hypothetical protein
MTQLNVDSAFEWSSLYIVYGKHVQVLGSDVQSVMTVSRKVLKEYVPTGKPFGTSVLVGEAPMPEVGDPAAPALVPALAGTGSLFGALELSLPILAYAHELRDKVNILIFLTVLFQPDSHANYYGDYAEQQNESNDQQPLPSSFSLHEIARLDSPRQRWRRQTCFLGEDIV